jgi:hypothetical protein
LKKDQDQVPQQTSGIARGVDVADASQLGTSQWKDLMDFEQQIKEGGTVPTLSGPMPPDVSRAKVGRNPYDTQRTTINQVQTPTVPGSLKYATSPVSPKRETLQDAAAQRDFQSTPSAPTAQPAPQNTRAGCPAPDIACPRTPQ